MEEKIKQYLQLKLKMKDLENAVKFLETEIRDEIKDSIKMDWYVIAKRNRINYSVKEWIDVAMIAKEYPNCVSIKVDWKELYRVAENAHDMIDKKISEYLEVRIDKNKDDEEIEF